MTDLATAESGGGEEIFELVTLAGGIQSLRSCANGETFHPVVGPAREAAELHVAGTRLVERANDLPPGQGPVVWDVGLGAGANALAAIEALATGYKRIEPVKVLSFDRGSAALAFAVAHADALVYPGDHVGLLRKLLAGGEVVVPIGAATLQWRLCLGDFTTPGAFASQPAPHAIFFDPYSPATNPEMWTLELFTSLRAALRADTSCLLTSYTRSTAVRVTMLLAGFFVGIGPSTGEKDETTVATNDPASLTRPLTLGWVEGKVRASTNAAPLRAGGNQTRGPISERDFSRLRMHRQFVRAN